MRSLSFNISRQGAACNQGITFQKYISRTPFQPEDVLEEKNDERKIYHIV
jgi:hypothetical protein